MRRIFGTNPEGGQEPAPLIHIEGFPNWAKAVLILILVCLAAITAWLWIWWGLPRANTVVNPQPIANTPPETSDLTVPEITALAPDGNIKAVAQGTTLHLYDAVTNELSPVVWETSVEEGAPADRVHQANIVDLEFSEDGLRLASLDSSGKSLIWNVSARTVPTWKHAFVGPSSSESDDPWLKIESFSGVLQEGATLYRRISFDQLEGEIQTYRLFEHQKSGEGWHLTHQAE